MASGSVYETRTSCRSRERGVGPESIGPGVGRLWLIALLVLEACSEPAFQFRGYSDQSGCRAVIDAELSAGAEFVDALDEALPDGPGLVTELAGSILSVPVTIEVACYPDGAVSFVDYVSAADEPAASDGVYGTFAHELDSVYGETEEDRFVGRRSKTYWCDESARVSLRQAQISEASYEVSLLVIPHRTDCP